MARPLRIQFPGALYHATSRGNERREIFRDDSDRYAFLRILSESADTYGIILHAFVLMDNHWHLLVQTPLANLSEFMRHLNITYTSHYNRRHRRVGHLYQGRYRSFLVEEDAYLCTVSRYIHLNPVRTAALGRRGAAERLRHLWNYRWSSLPGYVNLAPRLAFVEYATVLAAYGNDRRPAETAYRDQLIADLSGGFSIHDLVVGQSIMGSEPFIARVRETALPAPRDRERPAVGRIHRYLSLGQITAVLERELGGADPFGATGTARQVVMSMLYRHGGLNNRQIAALLGLDYSTVSRGRKRLRGKIVEDGALRELVEKIERTLSRIKI